MDASFFELGYNTRLRLPAVDYGEVKKKARLGAAKRALNYL